MSSHTCRYFSAHVRTFRSRVLNGIAKPMSSRSSLMFLLRHLDTHIKMIASC